MFFLKNKKKYFDNKGFTLVETLVAISIFTVSVLALLSVVSGSLQDLNYAKRRIIANYLAQEGIEFMKNLRDTYVLYTESENGWLDFQTKIAFCNQDLSTSGCFFFLNFEEMQGSQMPITNLAVNNCSGSQGACPALLFDEETGFYGYATGSNSGFTRTITTRVVNDKEIEVNATVSWRQASGVRSLTVSDTLFNYWHR